LWLLIGLDELDALADLKVARGLVEELDGALLLIK
jgi:hypothetical protein